MEIRNSIHLLSFTSFIFMSFFILLLTSAFIRHHCDFLKLSLNTAKRIMEEGGTDLNLVNTKKKNTKNFYRLKNFIRPSLPSCW